MFIIYYSLFCIFQDYSNSETKKILLEIDMNSEFLKNKNILCKLDCFMILSEFVYNYFISKNNKAKVLNEIENSNIYDKKEYDG